MDATALRWAPKSAGEAVLLRLDEIKRVEWAELVAGCGGQSGFFMVRIYKTGESGEGSVPMTLLGFQSQHRELLQRYLTDKMETTTLALSGRNYGTFKLNNECLPQEGLLRMYFREDEGFTVPLGDVESCAVDRQVIRLNLRRDDEAEQKEAVQKRGQEDHMLQEISFFVPAAEDDEESIYYVKSLIDQYKSTDADTVVRAIVPSVRFAYPSRMVSCQLHFKETVVEICSEGLRCPLPYEKIGRLFLFDQPSEVGGRRVYLVVDLLEPLSLKGRSVHHLVLDLATTGTRRVEHMNEVTMARLAEFVEDEAVVGSPFDVVRAMFTVFGGDLVSRMTRPVDAIGPSVARPYVGCTLEQRDTGYIYFLHKSLFYLCKPTPLYVRFRDIRAVVLVRAGSSKTYNLELKYRVGGVESVTFKAIDASTQRDVTAFFKSHDVTVKQQHADAGGGVDLGDDDDDDAVDESDEDDADYQGGGSGSDDDDEKYEFKEGNEEPDSSSSDDDDDDDDDDNEGGDDDDSD